MLPAIAVELVAVEIAKIAGIKTWQSTRPGRAFILATEFDRLAMNGVDFLVAVDGECDHHAIADSGCVAVIRPGNADRRFVGTNGRS